MSDRKSKRKRKISLYFVVESEQDLLLLDHRFDCVEYLM
jgi:hypothetical protein